MNKKFSKTILSSAVAGLLLVSVNSFAQEVAIGDYKIIVDDTTESARIVQAKDNKDIFTGVINIKNGTITTVNTDEVNAAIARFSKEKPDLVKDQSALKMVAQAAGEAARYSISLPPEFPSITEGNLQNITVADIEKIKSNVDAVSTVITSKTAADYNQAVSNGMSTEAALTVAKDGNGALLQEFNRLGTNVNALKDTTTFALDENGEITDGQGVKTVSVKSVVADVKADTTIYQNKDGSYTLDPGAAKNVRVNDAIVDLDKNLKDRTTVGVNSDGSLTTAEGAAKTVAVSEGLVSLSGRTDRIDAAVGGIDTRVTKNTQTIQNHSRQLQEHNARLNSQQRQIRENHEEMKRAAAQSAALSGLFQPYSVGKFNATAALGGYSDKQAVAVGVGYRFNEQTAAKAGVAASDGDVSYNVGVNFEF
ncbi:YadA-like family protein [Escherichia coli]|nr:YadA-like family protein [Escherichia coli]